MELEIPVNIGDYLPKYLSAESFSTLLEELKAFPTDGTKNTVYTSLLQEQKILFQGDGLAKLPYYDSQTQTVLKDKPGIILSNTCDMDAQDKKRLEDIHICFAPLFRLSKYQERLSKQYDTKRIYQHIESIKKQKISHIFYLPKGGDLDYEAIVPLDRICYVNNSFVDRENLNSCRLFTLSDYGNYLFLLKMSIHFTRIREKVDRSIGIIINS
ncbi:MAG: hypothetical protein LBR65_07995 [Culturomica sp.]|jgi:hypothetical protein|nr:hypothetical protein [Culturomica sp.]